MWHGGGGEGGKVFPGVILKSEQILGVDQAPEQRFVMMNGSRQERGVVGKKNAGVALTCKGLDGVGTMKGGVKPVAGSNKL